MLCTAGHHNSKSEYLCTGRLISDLIAYELTHFLLNNRDGDLGYEALKLDMSKAYDCVEWNFLEAMMRRMDFAEQ